MGAAAQSTPQKQTNWLLPLLAGAALIGLAVALWLIPPEQTLGNVIKVIFLHGALVRVGLLTFG